MTFEAILKAHARKIGESWGNMSEDLTTEALERVASSYWEIVQETGCTWQKPTLLTLTAVTLTTNAHRLSTALGLTAGTEVLNVSELTWQGKPIPRWDKEKIDQSNEYFTGVSSSEPWAYAFWEEWNASDNDKRTYIAFYPFLSEANSVDYRLSYFLRPAKPTISNYNTLNPTFAPEYHELIAERSALKWLRDIGDRKFNLPRMGEVENKIVKMRSHYTQQISSFLALPDPLSRNGRFVRGYGVGTYDT